ncbi:FUSC family protein [Caballeronia cordobensis]|uniref:FUSC family protein n=1 Tax=Caballeronia cordobensis TaxID=1353886 RepID=UPI00045EFDAD|nr:fusaric acid resistance protein conserved region [Burkholderia sp. RPE67]
MSLTWSPSRNMLAFASRTAFAVVLALWCSSWFGLHEPHWAAWTVVSVSLPDRGDGLMKSLNRAIGTIVGAPVGVLLAFVARDSPTLLVALLGAWLAACVHIGMTSRNYRAYAGVLAGYTAVIVAMSVAGEPDQLLELGRDRCFGILIGLMFAMPVLILSESVRYGEGRRRIRKAISEACMWSAQRLAGLPRPAGEGGSGPQRLRGQLKETLSLDSAVQSVIAESPLLWRGSHRWHGLVGALVDLLLLSRGVERNRVTAGGGNERVGTHVADLLEAASVLLHQIAEILNADQEDDGGALSDLIKVVAALERRVSEAVTMNPTERRYVDLLASMLAAIDHALTRYAGMSFGHTIAGSDRFVAPAYALNRHLATAASIRACLALWIAGSCWIVTRWSDGPLFVAFAAIVVALFAIRPDPRQTGIHFFGSGAFGAVAALLLFSAGISSVDHGPSIALLEGGIVLLGIAAASALSNPFWGSGFCLVFLVVADPEALDHTAWAQMLSHASGVLAGAALAALAFFVVPGRKLERGWNRARAVAVRDAVLRLSRTMGETSDPRISYDWQFSQVDALVRFAMPFCSEDEIEQSVAWLAVGGELLRLHALVRTRMMPLVAVQELHRLFRELANSSPNDWRDRLDASARVLSDVTQSEQQKVMSAVATTREIIALLEVTLRTGVDRSGPEART